MELRSNLFPAVQDVVVQNDCGKGAGQVGCKVTTVGYLQPNPSENPDSVHWQEPGRK